MSDSSLATRSAWLLRTLACVTLAGCLWLRPGQAVAQDQGSDSDQQQKSEQDSGQKKKQPTEKTELEQITVTARLREETLQDVPIAVSAFSGDQLEELGAPDITYLSEQVPNTTLEVSRGTNSTLTAFIRGIGQQDPVAGFESGVGIYLDGVYLNRPQGAVLDIYDVERVEVLRGPQGTLYGRNTIGGAVKYVTKRLGFTPSLTLRGSAGSYGQADLVATGELPLSDTVSVGGSVASFRHSGYGDDLYLGRDNYNKDISAARGTLEWSPTPELFVRLSGDYTDDDSNPVAGHRLIPGLFSGAPVLNDVYDTRAGIMNKNTAQQSGGTLLVEYDLNTNWMLRNITAYREDDNHQAIDFEGLPARDVDVPVRYRNHQFSQELQLHYTSDLVKGVAGFYYLNANAYNVFDVILAPTGDLIGLPGLNAFTLGDVDTKSWSVFSDVTFDLGSYFDMDTGLELGIGGRYTSDERSSRVLRQTMIGGNSSYFGGDATPIATTSDFNGSETFTDFSPRVSLAWMPVPTQNLYVSYSQGFKGGGFDPRGATTAAPDLNNDGTVDQQEIFDFMKFDPEQVDTYELGAKSRWADGRINTNVAVFYSDYKDVQVPGSVGVDTDGDGIADTFAGVTTNAAAATVKGVELEGTALLGTDLFSTGDSLSTRLSVGYIDANYDKFITAVANPATGETALQDVSDQRTFQNTPEWTGYLDFRYDRRLDLFGTGGNFSAIAAWAYRSLTHQFETPSRFLDQGAYTLFNLDLLWSTLDGKYEFGLHGLNLTDKEYKVSGYQFVTPDGSMSTLGLEGVANAFYGPPRTVTATMTVHF